MAEEKVAPEDKDYGPNRTLCLIKPACFSRSDEIIKMILADGFRVVKKKQVSLTKVKAEAFYAVHKGKGFFEELTTFMSSGPIYALMLEKADNDKGEKAWQQWRKLMGPTKREENQKEEYSNTIRNKFATDTTKNAVHGSNEEDGPDTTKNELKFFFNVEQTLALIKPDAVAAGKDGEIIKRIQDEQFLIIEQKKITLTKERAEAFYAEHKGRGFFESLITLMTSGPIVVLKLEKTNGIKAWRDLMGPTDCEEAKKSAPKSIRALYGKDKTANASHGSDSISSAARELEFFFPLSETLALLKPDGVKAGKAPEIIDRIVKEGFTILESEKLTLTKERAEAFYAEHAKRSFFESLINLMTSGPIYVLKLQRGDSVGKGDDEKEGEIRCFKAWRNLMGPTNSDTAKKEAPKSIRALYGTDSTANASHGSDSVESAKKELEFYFPTADNKPRGTKELTYAMVKPKAVATEGVLDQIKARIKYDGFVIIDEIDKQLTLEEAQKFYEDLSKRGFYKELTEFMSSGPMHAFKLEREDAVLGWRKLIGPTNTPKLKQNEREEQGITQCLRALYATDMTKNACHGSDAISTAENELNFFFPKDKK